MYNAMWAIGGQGQGGGFRIISQGEGPNHFVSVLSVFHVITWLY